MMLSKKPERLMHWIDTIAKMIITETALFVDETKKDITAAQNGIAYDYNNGLAEGIVNKVKIIKRIMYGGNSFELVKAKVLMKEEFYHQIN